jgi:threonine synthase
MSYRLQCMSCGTSYNPSIMRYVCKCGGLLDVLHNLEALGQTVSRELFDDRRSARSLPYTSGVWRYREFVLPVPEDEIVSRNEGNTPLLQSRALSDWVGIDDLSCKHEGENPTGSFKDRGMTVGVTQARRLGARAVACASTGNTSASMAAYAALAGLKALVLIPEGEIAYGKLSQSLAYGAKTLQVQGDFDSAMGLVQQVCEAMDIYLLNSVNPFRVEGQKAIICEMMQQRNWEPPDWVVYPAGNLGNSAAFGKALHEMREIGLIDKLPRLAAVQAHGANPFYRSFQGGFQKLEWIPASTVASAIRIGYPVSYARAVRSLNWTNGLVTEVTDDEIMNAKAQVDRAGIGCEPASAAAIGGARRLVMEGIINRDDTVVAVLTGHLLKDPTSTVDYHMSRMPGIESRYANQPQIVEPTMDAVAAAVGGMLQ